MKKFRRWICSKIGHKFSSMAVLIFDIKTNPLNRDPDATIKCNICGDNFEHKDADDWRARGIGPRREQL